MEDIKEELYHLLEQNNIAEVFDKIDRYQTDNIIKIKDEYSLSRLKDEFIQGRIDIDFAPRLKTWISINLMSKTNVVINLKDNKQKVNSPYKKIIIVSIILVVISIIMSLTTIFIFNMPNNKKEDKHNDIILPKLREVSSVIISETNTTDTESLLGVEKLGRGFKNVGYHYIVESNGGIISFVDEERIIGHTSGQNQSSIGIGLIHINKIGAEILHQPHKPIPKAQIDGLIRLLSKLVKERKLKLTEIRSKEEFQPHKKLDITKELNKIRLAVGKYRKD